MQINASKLQPIREGNKMKNTNEFTKLSKEELVNFLMVYTEKREAIKELKKQCKKELEVLLSNNPLENTEDNLKKARFFHVELPAIQKEINKVIRKIKYALNKEIVNASKKELWNIICTPVIDATPSIVATAPSIDAPASSIVEVIETETAYDKEAETETTASNIVATAPSIDAPASSIVEVIEAETDKETVYDKETDIVIETAYNVADLIATIKDKVKAKVKNTVIYTAEETVRDTVIDTIREETIDTEIFVETVCNTATLKDKAKVKAKKTVIDTVIDIVREKVIDTFRDKATVKDTIMDTVEEIVIETVYNTLKDKAKDIDKAIETDIDKTMDTVIETVIETVYKTVKSKDIDKETVIEIFYEKTIETDIETVIETVIDAVKETVIAKAIDTEAQKKTPAPNKETVAPASNTETDKEAGVTASNAGIDKETASNKEAVKEAGSNKEAIDKCRTRIEELLKEAKEKKDEFTYIKFYKNRHLDKLHKTFKENGISEKFLKFKEELASIFKNDNETEQETYRMPVTLPKAYYKPLYISHCR